MKEILKLGGILLLITGICTGLVATVNGLTEGPIARQEQLKKEEAMTEVLPCAEEYEELEAQEENIKEVYIGMKDSEEIGFTVTVSPKGYDGPIEMMVGINLEGEVKGVTILSHSETPGLGANADDPEFTDQFKSQSEIDDVVAITGATITSDAVVDGIREALEYVASIGGVQ